MVRGFLFLILICLLHGQDAPKPATDTFFSGSVVALSDTEITVRRRDGYRCAGFLARSAIEPIAQQVLEIEGAQTLAADRL